MFSSIINTENLITYAEILSRRKFRPGYDSMTAEGALAWLRINGDRLCRELHDGVYRPMPAVGFRTAKNRGGYRKLSRLTALDTVIQQAVLDGVTQICEERFSDNSFAYRSDRGVSAAVTRYIALAGTYGFAAKLDFSACFDNMDHGVLENALKIFFEDEKIAALIMQYVRMPVSDDGEILNPEKGILQGMPLSPLLCNIYLHSADCFMAEKEIPFVRYGDDIVLFAKTPEEAEAWRDAVCTYCKTECRLSCHSGKCRIDSPSRLTYLGHRFESDRRGLIAESGADDSRVTYHTWRSGEITDPHRRVDILSDGILRQRDYDLLFETETEENDIPPMTTDVINIYSNVIFDDGFLKYAMKSGIRINVFDEQYNKIGTFLPDRPLKSPSLLHKQLLVYYDEEHRLSLAKEFVLAYIHNVCLNIRYHNKETPAPEYKEVLTALEKLKKKIKDECDSYDNLLMLEAQAHREYYSCFDLMLQEEGFVFETRSERPPKNEVNSLLSFGNTVLYNLLAAEIQKTSLDIQVGFLHATNQRRESLNLDMAEIFKPLIVDRVVFRLINMRILKAEHFRHFEDGAVYLNADGKRIFLRAFYDKLETVVSVGVQKKRMSYNSIIAEEIRKLIRHFRQDEKYKAFRQVR
ncbi:MAG: CRISPR-associated endonuclease Cas1 [Clostridia bacterium]|nr:CRISPR-associated endonuclease Cas1 [Clostridia bacterium]